MDNVDQVIGQETLDLHWAEFQLVWADEAGGKVVRSPWAVVTKAWVPNPVPTCMGFVTWDKLLFLRAAPKAHGGSQARGQIRAVAAGLRHRHSNAGSKPQLRPIPQLEASADP